MRYLLLLFSLFLSACGTGKSCEQAENYSSDVVNKSANPIEVDLVSERGFALTVSVEPGESKDVKAGSGTRHVESSGRPPIPSDAYCSREPYSVGTRLYLAKDPAQVSVKACIEPRYETAKVLLIDKTATCPDGFTEQTKAGHVKK